MADEKEKTTKREEAKVHPTNEHDVAIAKDNTELLKFEFQLGSELIKLKENNATKTRRFETIMNATERIVISGMVIGGLAYTSAKRYDMLAAAAEFGVE